MNRPIKLGIVGIGKIARDQHLPAIAGQRAFELTGAASRHPFDRELIRYATLDELLEGEPALDAVSLCTPPRGRDRLAAKALAAGKHVMLEKPPGSTVSEVLALADLARAANRTLFATWHSREAAAVGAAREWLAGRNIRSVRIEWREDIRVWHPGQDWILEAGGLGVFDPGINALSVATAILPLPLLIQSARLAFPRNRAAPIAVDLAMVHGEAPVEVAFDFLYPGDPCWDITVETDGGTLLLREGAARMWVDGVECDVGPNREYPALYERFAELIERGESDVDVRPLQLVADAFLIGEHVAAPAFEWDG